METYIIHITLFYHNCLRLWLYNMLEAIWLYHKNMQNLENMDVFEILITQKLLKCPKDPFVRSALIYIWQVFLFGAIGSKNIKHQNMRPRKNDSKFSNTI